MQKTITKTHARITTEIVTVTPDIAEAWLEKNEKNRKPANSIVARFARDMASGNWQLTGDAIRFDINGLLLDGQHRLMACRRAKKSFMTFVMYGLEPETQDVMDTGKVRKAQDALSLRGLTNANHLNGALRALIAYREGATSSRMVSCSTAEIIDTFERHPNITKSVALANAGMPRTTPRGSLAMLHYLATAFLGQTAAANDLIQVFKTGIPTYHGDVMHVLRERFINLPKVGQNIKHVVASQTMHYAWNLFVEKRSVGILRWQKQFVEIDGVDRSIL